MKNRKKEQKKHEDCAVEMEGEITKILNGMMMLIKLDNGINVTGFLSGKMRQFNIRLSLGDRVKIEMSPYDLTKGRITYRMRG